MKWLLWRFRLMMHGPALFSAALDADRLLSQLLEHGGIYCAKEPLLKLDAALRKIGVTGAYDEM